MTETPLPRPEYLLEDPVPSATLTRTCPAYCARIHDEQPDEVVAHETPVVGIPALGSRPLRLQMSQADCDPAPRLHVGSYDLDLYNAERLLAELHMKVTIMREAQARLHASLTVA
ncbi:hypothetical protein GCM10010109_67000 [Actinoplanes campanulatus]|nr:hypothetical protein GCM10010109_67000 [Actinoplanes campanulatus]